MLNCGTLFYSACRVFDLMGSAYERTRGNFNCAIRGSAGPPGLLVTGLERTNALLKTHSSQSRLLLSSS